MKTISISIDEDTLEQVNRLVATGGNGRNRSQVISQAVREYVERLERFAEDEREARIVRQHRGKLTRQARALVRQQGRP
jgi:metal-responsive CopG/Arc/MetJ family transcriptional regulator